MNVTSAWPCGPSSISFTEPAFVPPTTTSLPLTSWPAFWNSAVTSYSSPPLVSRTTTATTAITSATRAAMRPITSELSLALALQSP